MPLSRPRLFSKNQSNFDLDSINSLVEKLVEDKSNGGAAADFPDLNSVSYVDYGAFQKLKNLSNDRRKQYEAYDAMTKDIIISSALEMYSDDATQYDNEGRLIWAEGSNKDLIKDINERLDLLEIPKKLWSIYYNLAEYGDVYLRLFKKTDINPEANQPIEKNPNALNESVMDFSVPYEDYIELYDEPENVFDLLKNGKTCQFAVINKTAGRHKQERIELYPPDQFVHIYIENPHIRDKQFFEFKTREKGKLLEENHIYKVRRGKSMLHDIYAVEKEIQLLENALLLNRLSKSAITRIINLEVGNTPPTEVRKMTRRVKNAFESKLSINNQQIDTYVSSSGLDNVVVSPTRDGKGELKYQTIGGDVDVRAIVDLDYFNDKRFGGLKIPKAFLGYDEALGANAGGTLTRMDARYGRSVKKLQTCVVEGITQLINLWLLHTDRSEHVNDFTIRVVSPVTVDDLDRDERLQTRLGMIDTLMVVAGNDPSIDKTQLFNFLMSNYLSDSRISTDLSQFSSKLGGGTEESEESGEEHE